ncbi:hypothetical protein [Microbacterium sp. 22242]|uniref:hypothetical protein n=1 Tax=Microbacterium sp. 22242 TaxID=3453896 RepID=UPI003F86D32B
MTVRISRIRTEDELGPAAYELVDIDRYAVLLESTIGYVDVVPPLFVCYLGHPYAKAIEIAQLHDFDASVRLVQERAARARSSRTHG